ncbi:hypothetical protein K504DRAFT_186567 [Pleomassaria siparia CBS 279.74]|uniref:Uncharacterized protein n=1 Tax=Pleomassaria siparia CBS 279.74 TaxID=1314801 RepID=A0A6G1JQW2_9PLEO|nr:hypothetical protein K504DRAFT_186567 [Pleomassaria siparia CBS 279.74]
MVHLPSSIFHLPSTTTYHLAHPHRIYSSLGIINMTVISGRRPLSSLPFDEAPLHHAHPHPQNRKPNSSQQIRELLRTIHVDLRLRGLPGANTSKVTDLYCPEVRRSMPMRNRHINHLDVVSCWKGLSFRRASEVLLWEDLFRHSLESQVRDTLLHNLAEHLSHRHGA